MAIAPFGSAFRFVILLLAPGHGSPICFVAYLYTFSPLSSLAQGRARVAVVALRPAAAGKSRVAVAARIVGAPHPSAARPAAVVSGEAGGHRANASPDASRTCQTATDTDADAGKIGGEGGDSKAARREPRATCFTSAASTPIATGHSGSASRAQSRRYRHAGANCRQQHGRSIRRASQQKGAKRRSQRRQRGWQRKWRYQFRCLTRIPYRARQFCPSFPALPRAGAGTRLGRCRRDHCAFRRRRKRSCSGSWRVERSRCARRSGRRHDSASSSGKCIAGQAKRP